VREFLQRVQLPPAVPAAAPPDPQHWVLVDSITDTYEHASWISSAELEEMLGGDLNRSTARSADLKGRSANEQLRVLLAEPSEFVAVVADDQRFDYLLDRSVILEQVAHRMSSTTDGRG
jgi:hypothetical protein